MSLSGASTAATSDDDSGYDQSSGGGGGSNYNYLSFFARGSYGRKLEQQRSRDPVLARFEEEKRRWKWITGTALSFMALINVVMATGLIAWKYQKFQTTELTGSLLDTVEHFMKTELKTSCRPRYRKTKECSQVAAQMFLVANPARDQVVWSDERNFTGYDIFTLGAFSCEGIESNKVVGKFKIEKDSFYQIHSHLSFHSFPYGSRLHHAISREHRSVSLPLASENVTITHNCTAVTPPSDRVTIDGTCFTSSLLATDQLIVGDLISIELKLNGITVIHPLSPIVKRTPGVNLVYDGKSSYFSIVKLGKLNNK